MRFASAVLLLLSLHGPSVAQELQPQLKTIVAPNLTDVGTEAEAEVEVEAAAGPQQAAGALSVGGAVGTLGGNGLAQVMVSGSLSMKANGGPGMIKNHPVPNAAIRFADADFDGRDGPPPASDGTEGSCFISTDSAEAEAGVEVESEAEAEVSEGSAVAAAGTSIAAGAGGYQSFITTNGASKPVKAQTLTAVDGQSSTSTSVNSVAGDGTMPINSPVNDTLSTPLFGRDLAEDIPDQTELGFTPYLKIDSETEVEVESESEAEAEVAPGAAAAAATGGTGVSVVGDFAAAAALTSVVTSTSTSELAPPTRRLRRGGKNMRNGGKKSSTESNDASPNGGKKGGNGGNGGNGGKKGGNGGGNGGDDDDDEAGHRLQQTFDPVSPDALFTAAGSAFDNTGRGLFEAESEAEAEAEVEAEVGERSAAVAVSVTGGAGQTGIAASARVAVSSSASTSTIDDLGVEIRANDVIATAFDRETGLPATYLPTTPAGAEVEVEASAAINSTGPVAVIEPLEGTQARGESTAAANLLLAGTVDGVNNTVEGVTQLEEVPRSRGEVNPRPPNGDGEFTALFGNLETEVESEVEVEAEAETAFEAAAAGAGAVAVQGRNGIPSVPAEAATATSASTKVLDNDENRVEDMHLPGPAKSGGLGGFPSVDVNLDCVRFETEMEAEAEAEVGYFAGAAAASAAGVGRPPLAGYGADTNLTTTLVDTTPFAAAAASAAGPFRQVWIEVPAAGGDPNEEKFVRAYALARDPDGGAVAVAVAVAGTPNSTGLDNEMEMEAEGQGEVMVMVEISFKEGDAMTAMALVDNPEMSAAPSMAPSSSFAPTNIEGETAEQAEPDGGEGIESTFEDESEAEAEAEAEADYGVAAAAAGAGASGFYSDASAATSTSTIMPEGGFDYAAINMQILNMMNGMSRQQAVARPQYAGGNRDDGKVAGLGLGLNGPDPDY